MKKAADAAKAPVETAAVLAMAPVAMVAPANVVMVAEAERLWPVVMVASVHVRWWGCPWIRQKVKHIA